MRSKYNEVEPFCERSHAIWEKVLGSEHPKVAASLDLRAALLEIHVRVQGVLVEASWGSHVSLNRF